MATLTEQADFDLLYQVLSGEIQRVKPWGDPLHRQYQWVMDMQMLAMIRRLTPAWASVPSVVETLVGYQFEVRDGVEGIHLEAVA